MSFYAQKKTEYECYFPFLYAYPRVKERLVVGGFNTICPDGRDYFLHYKDNIEGWRSDSFLEVNSGQILQHKISNRKYGIRLFVPFSEQEFYRCLYNTSFDDVNKPKLKQVLIDAFSEYFKDIEYRYPLNFQCGENRISELFSSVVLKSDWNLHEYKSMSGIYNSINRGELPCVKRKLI